MSKRLNWWWVVATHERGNITEMECCALGMIEFLNWQTAARVFTSKRIAEAWIRRLKLLNSVPEGIELRVLSDEAWEFSINMYHRGMANGQTLL